MFKIRGRIWIENESGTHIGHGRVTLLERIKIHGSITEAAKSMGMSYRHAWEMIDSMNKQAKSPIVERTSGGKGGGGTNVTDEGELLIRAFHDLQNKFKHFKEAETKLFNK